MFTEMKTDQTIKTLSQKRNVFLFFEHSKQTLDGGFRF